MQHGAICTRMAAAAVAAALTVATSACGILSGLDEYRLVDDETLLETGEPCSDASACETEHCVGGICCDARCDQPCQACSAVLKGSGRDGECGPAAAGTPCGAPARCIDGMHILASACDDLGLCVAGGSIACASGACDPNGQICAVVCDQSADCPACQGCSFDGACADEAAACGANPDCLALSDCVNDCYTACEMDPDPMCYETCVNGAGGCIEMFPNGVDDLNTVYTCILEQCPTTCA
jgi:hypothetical protein